MPLPFFVKKVVEHLNKNKLLIDKQYDLSSSRPSADVLLSHIKSVKHLKVQFCSWKTIHINKEVLIRNIAFQSFVMHFVNPSNSSFAIFMYEFEVQWKNYNASWSPNLLFRIKFTL